jgi:t-SNARE complex subunit (syntaxin)
VKYHDRRTHQQVQVHCHTKQCQKKKVYDRFVAEKKNHREELKSQKSKVKKKMRSLCVLCAPFASLALLLFPTRTLQISP